MVRGAARYGPEARDGDAHEYDARDPGAGHRRTPAGAAGGTGRGRAGPWSSRTASASTGVPTAMWPRCSAQSLDLDVLAVNLRGHGASPGRRGIVRRYDELTGDLTSAMDWFAQRSARLAAIPPGALERRPGRAAVCPRGPDPAFKGSSFPTRRCGSRCRSRRTRSAWASCSGSTRRGSP